MRTNKIVRLLWNFVFFLLFLVVLLMSFMPTIILLVCLIFEQLPVVGIITISILLPFAQFVILVGPFPALISSWKEMKNEYVNKRSK